MASTSLLSGWLLYFLYALGAIGLGLLLAGTWRYMRLAVPVSLGVGVVAGFGAKVIVEDWINPWGQKLEWPIWFAVGGLAATITALVMKVLENRRQLGKYGKWYSRRTVWFIQYVVPTFAFMLVLVGTTAFSNKVYSYVPTVGMLWGDKGVVIDAQPPPTIEPEKISEKTPTIKLAEWQPPADMPAKGKVIEAEIPTPASGLPSGKSFVYLPPAYLTQKPANVPVLVAIHGEPGYAEEWLTSGQLAKTMDDYAAQNKGVAPAVVVPDISSKAAPDWTQCYDTKIGKGATYLSVDVTNYMKNNFRLGLGGSPRQFASVGYSGGGTCSQQMAVISPNIYGTFLSMSAEAEYVAPRGGKQGAIAKYFDGNPAAYAKVNALDVLKTQKFPQIQAKLLVGTADREFSPQVDQFYQALKGADAKVELQKIPGGHTWEVWRDGLRMNVDWFMIQYGVK